MLLLWLRCLRKKKLSLWVVMIGLKEEHKALESKFSNLFEAHEQLQTQLTCDHAKSSAVQIIDLSSTPNPCCKHEHLIEEVKVLKYQLAKTKKKKKKRKNKKKKRNKGMAQGPSNGLTILQSDNFAGKNNPSYILCKSYDGHVYARYVGTSYMHYYHCDIWVKKFLVKKKMGPIKKCIPKTKVCFFCSTILPVNKNGCLIVVNERLHVATQVTC